VGLIGGNFMAAIESFDEIVKFLEEKKDSDEVKNFIKSLTPQQEIDLDTFLKKATENEDIDKYIRSQKDKAVTQGLETFKGKYKDRDGNLEAIVQAELNALREKLAPEESEVQKELRLVKEELARDKAEKQQEKMKNYLFKKFSEQQLPTNLIDRLRIAENEEGANTMVESLAKDWNAELERRVEDRLKGNVRDPQKSDIPHVDDDAQLSDFEYFTKKGIIGK